MSEIRAELIDGGARRPRALQNPATTVSHRSRKHNKFVRKFLGPIYFTLGALLASVSVVLGMHDSYIRRAATEDSPGDPPTMFMFGAYAAGIAATFLLVGAVINRRRRIQ